MHVQPVNNSLCRPGNGEYNLLLESVLGFSQPVALNTVDLPSGINSQFSSNPVVPTDTSVMTLTASETADPGSYTIAVTGAGGNRQHSVLVKLDLYSEMPTVPDLLTPANGSSELPLDVQFSWTAASQAATYDIQIGLDSDFEQAVEEKTGLINNAYTATNLLPGQLYYWRVRAVNSCDPGEYSVSNMFSTKQLPGGCPIGVAPKIFYSTDFEGSVSDWAHNGIEDTWQLSEARSHSATTSFYAEDLDEVSDQRLISPEIQLPADSWDLTLQFWNYQALESNELEGDICFDAAILEISTNNGQSWQQIGGSPHDNSILISNPYDGIVDDLHDNPLSGQYAWCGDPQDWINSVVRINNYAGETVRFRFRLGTDLSIGDEGWYIDDVRVQACQVDLEKSFMPMITDFSSAD